MARKGRSRRSRDPRTGRTRQKIDETVWNFPRGSCNAHPKRVWDYLLRLCRLYGHDLKFRFVEEIDKEVRAHVDGTFFPDRHATRVIMFPEEIFYRKEHDYEVGALCPDVIDHIGAKGAVRIAICEYLFYRCRERWFDAIEAASRALIEQERTRRTDETDIVDIVRKIETDALKRALLAKVNM